MRRNTVRLDYVIWWPLNIQNQNQNTSFIVPVQVYKEVLPEHISGRHTFIFHLFHTSVCFSDSLDLPIISRNYFDKEWEVGGGCKFSPIYLRFVDFAAIFATPLAVTKHICAREIARASANAHNERPLSSSKSKIPRAFESRNVGLSE